MRLQALVRLSHSSDNWSVPLLYDELLPTQHCRLKILKTRRRRRRTTTTTTATTTTTTTTASTTITTTTTTTTQRITQSDSDLQMPIKVIIWL